VSGVKIGAQDKANSGSARWFGWQKRNTIRRYIKKATVSRVDIQRESERVRGHKQNKQKKQQQLIDE